ncbi:MAG: hypothetical protein AB7E55_15920 [Pigmentiphaga sp.]
MRDLVLTWLANGVRRKDENAEVKRIFHKDVLPAIGGLPLRSLREEDLLGVLRQIVERGANRLAVMGCFDRCWPGARSGSLGVAC